MSAVDGGDTLAEHIGVAQQALPGASLVRTGEVEHCHGVVRFAWAIDGPDGTRLASGTNVADACRTAASAA